jgi:Zn-finger nucleic acid-binding protein
LFVPQSRVGELIAADTAAAEEDVSPALDERGGRCPQDRSIMSRTTIARGEGEASLHLERCSSCHGVWFDVGEWSALANRHMLEHLDEFWSAEWRKQERLAEDRAAFEARMKKVFGAELYYQLRSLAGVLRSHPRRSQALAFLREESAE